MFLNQRRTTHISPTPKTCHLTMPTTNHEKKRRRFSPLSCSSLSHNKNPQQESITTNIHSSTQAAREPNTSLQAHVPIVKPNNLSLSSRSLPSIDFRKLSELSLTKLSA